MTVCMPGLYPNTVSSYCFPLKLHDGGLGLRFNDGSDVKLKSVG